MQTQKRPIVALMLALTLTAAAAEAQTQVKPGWNLFSAQQDVEIGAQSAVQAERQLPLVRDREVEEYVNRIGQRLAANAGGPKFQYRFRVVNASDINAFALPGGFIYINRGIIENAKNEGEVASVVAHEIAHSALRHGTHQASKAYAAQAGLQILGGLLGGRVGNNTAQILNTVGGVGLNALFLKFTRELETQADVRGAQILAASGYSAADMVGFFRQLEKVDRSKKTTWLSHHPAPPDRIARIEKERRMLREPASPIQNTTQLASIKSELRGLGTARTMGDIARSGTAAQSGRTRSVNSGAVGSVSAPSSSYARYRSRSGAFTVAHPSNWRAYEGNGYGVTFAPQGGIASNGSQTEILYGAIINHYDPFGNQASSFGRGATLDDAASDLLAQIRQSSPHLRVVSGSAQQVRLNGANGRAATLRGVNPATRIEERVTVVTRALSDGHLIYLLFVTPERDAGRFSGTFESMVRSLDVNDRSRH